MTHRDFLVIDLEATCDDAGAVPRHQMEIIEIGAVLVDGASFTPRAEFQTFVRPVRHPLLTPFCTALTSITQAMVAEAPRFPEAIDALRSFSQGHCDVLPLFCSWGDYDREQFQQDASHHGVTLPFGHDHLNLKRAFSARQSTTRRFGMAGALRRVGLPLEGTHHRGIDDARNIARLLPWCVDPMSGPDRSSFD